MSEEDMDTDLEDLYSEMNPDELTPEEVYDMVLVNKAKGTKVSIELEDKDGDKVEVADIVEGLIGYIKDQLGEEGSLEGNDFVDQIMPLMTQSMVGGLGRMMGLQYTSFLMAQDGVRHSIIYMMCVSFLLLKYVQEHELLIHTYEEEVSEEVRYPQVVTLIGLWRVVLNEIVAFVSPFELFAHIVFESPAKLFTKNT